MPKKRKYCDHCNQDVSSTTVYEHRILRANEQAEKEIQTTKGKKNF